MDVKISGSLVCGNCQTDDIYVGTKSLNKHYGQRHQQLSNYVCGQLGCRKGYRDLTSMIRHITTSHKILFQPGNANHGEALPPPDDQGANDGAMDLSLEDEGIDDDSDDAICQHLGEDELENEEEDGTIQEQLNRAAVKLLLGLRSKASLTGAAVERFEKGCYDMIKKLCASIKKRVTVRLQDKGLSAEDAHEVLSEVESLTDPFKNLKTIDEQLNYYEKHYGLVKPTQKVLDTRIDLRLDPSTNAQVPTQVLETFQYVSVIKSLTAFLKNKKFRELVFKKQAPSNDNVLRSYTDGTHFKHHPCIQKHEGVIQLILFYDDLEIANSLGSKTIIHKLATFFGQVLNLPPEMSSRLSSIFLIALAHADDLKKKGAMEKVLSPLIQDLKKLAAGIEVTIDDETFILRAVLIVLTADTLAAHDLLGFLGPGAKHFCRRCMISRAEVRLNANAMGECRCPEEHQRHVDLVTERPILSTEYGVKKSCALNKAPFFDCTSSSVFDAFHDALEGCVPLDLKLVIRYFVLKLKLFTVKDLNHRIASFSYGVPDSKNKPSPNFTNDMLSQAGGKLKQTGSQMWCLMRSFPFLIGDYVPEDNPHMQLIFCLQNIMQIIFSFEIKREDLDHMDHLINLHNQSFHQLFVDVPDEDLYVEDPVENPINDDSEEPVDDPEAGNTSGLRQNLGERERVAEEQQGPADGAGTHRGRKRKMSKVHITNKLHHLKHYREMTLAFGPPVRMWCAKFEGRMKIFRQHASICCNFKNPPMTMAKMFQLSTLSALLGNSDEFLDFHRGAVMKTRESSHRALLNNAGLNDADEVIYTNSATVNGEEYRPSLFACLPGGPSTQTEFALITSVIVALKDVWLVLSPWKNEGLSPRLNAYHVIPDNRPPVLLRTKSLRHFRCIAPWNPQDSEEIYLSMRTVLV